MGWGFLMDAHIAVWRHFVPGAGSVTLMPQVEPYLPSAGIHEEALQMPVDFLAYLEYNNKYERRFLLIYEKQDLR